MDKKYKCSRCGFDLRPKEERPKNNMFCVCNREHKFLGIDNKTNGVNRVLIEYQGEYRL